MLASLEKRIRYYTRQAFSTVSAAGDSLTSGCVQTVGLYRRWIARGLDTADITPPREAATGPSLTQSKIVGAIPCSVRKRTR